MLFTPEAMCFQGYLFAITFKENAKNRKYSQKNHKKQLTEQENNYIIVLWKWVDFYDAEAVRRWEESAA